jgi:hypothetical protein
LWSPQVYGIFPLLPPETQNSKVTRNLSLFQPGTEKFVIAQNKNQQLKTFLYINLANGMATTAQCGKMSPYIKGEHKKQ